MRHLRLDCSTGWFSRRGLGLDWLSLANVRLNLLVLRLGGRRLALGRQRLPILPG
jgi:hypothetical protein